ncbi:MAG: ferrous iron transport protein B [Dorea sp.]|nr:ferrous iron transport protein B [Dorea sp.]
MTLKELKIGESGLIEVVGGDGALRQHFLDMGVIPGAEITVIKYAPMGDPIEVKIHGYSLTLRLADAEKIGVKKIKKEEEEEIIRERRRKLSEHPSIGEPGIHHEKGSGDLLPEDHMLTFALVGNQNCGKTTLFNRLTGANQHVGNFPGVTVDRKDGSILGHSNTNITDLPGIYSMSPYTSEEIVSRNMVIQDKPDGIINIVDATNMERNLYLTLQLIEMNRPMVIALNMMDELTGNGGAVDINKMESMLGVPIVAIAAIKNQGVSELIDHAIHVAQYQEAPEKIDFCDKDGEGAAVHRCLHAVSHLIEDHAIEAGLPVRFAASKAIEGDELILEQLHLDRNEVEILEHITLQMEHEGGLDRRAAMADMRFRFIEEICDACLIKPVENKEKLRSEKIDSVLTGKYTALPFFIGIMGLVFYLTFNVIGAFLQNLMDIGIEKLTFLVDRMLVSADVTQILRDMIINGIFEGVGSVLSFLPIVVTMFFFLSMLEDSGYIARVAFVMDKLLRKIGLSGRSIVPLLIGFGCSVPAVMSTRTLPSDRDRKMTIFLTPFMSCTAKLPIYAFFVNAFFPGKGGLIMTALYALGILVGILVALVFKHTLFKGEAVPFVMELPNYRLPSLRSTLQLMWEKAKDFLQKAFTVILVATVVVWFLQTFDPSIRVAVDSSDSIMAILAGWIAPLFAPLGLGDWRIVTSLVCGVMAKESVVSTLEVLFGAQGGVNAVLNTTAAGALLVFSLLYTPCIAAIASIKRELGGRSAFAVAIWQCLVAWVVAFGFTLIAGIF